MTILKRDTQHHTYGDYLIWSATHGNELIDGAAYVREPPSPSRLHQEIVVELCSQLAIALEHKSARVYVAPLDIRLPKSTEADELVDTVLQPDVFIVSDLRKLDERGMRGAPDWVAEVLSPSTASHNLNVKLPAYERAGVREVWYIQPLDRTLAIYRLKAGRYGQPTIVELKGRTELSAVADVSIDWGRALAKMS